MSKPIALAADHGGFELKEAVRAHLDEIGVAYKDFGSFDGASCDYPDMAEPACRAVVAGECDKALLFCGTGVGISISANKIHGIRATPSAPSTPAATTTPTPCAWAAAWWALALPSILWIFS